MNMLSAVIITFNEEQNILRCIQSLRMVADEILVMDSFSTDNTRAVALAQGAKVIDQKFLGYGAQKNAVASYSSYDYVLNLDADEFLSQELSESIRQEKIAGFSADYYSMNRLNKYRGQWIRHGTWYPDRKIRLYNRRKASWSDSLVHEEVLLDGGSKPRHLAGDILHHAYETEEQHRRKNEKYSTLSAQEMLQTGRRVSPLNLLTNPAWAFIHSYLIKLGVLDGVNGFRIARNIAWLNYLKNSKLLSLQKGKPL